MAGRGAFPDLAKVPLFSACSKKELQLIARRAERVKVPAGKVVLSQGGVRERDQVLELERAGVDGVILGPWTLEGDLEATLRTLRFAETIEGDKTAVFVNINPDEAEVMRREWQTCIGAMPLQLIESPYRSVTGPLLKYIDRVSIEDVAQLAQHRRIQRMLRSRGVRRRQQAAFHPGIVEHLLHGEETLFKRRRIEEFVDLCGSALVAHLLIVNREFQEQLFISAQKRGRVSHALVPHQDQPTPGSQYSRELAPGALTIEPMCGLG